MEGAESIVQSEPDAQTWTQDSKPGTVWMNLEHVTTPVKLPSSLPNMTCGVVGWHWVAKRILGSYYEYRLPLLVTFSVSGRMTNVTCGAVSHFFIKMFSFFTSRFLFKTITNPKSGRIITNILQPAAA